jgi:phosphohistidine phosphatase SixA
LLSQKVPGAPAPEIWLALASGASWADLKGRLLEALPGVTALVGHNPDVSLLVRHLCGRSVSFAPGSAALVSLPPGGVEGRGTLSWFYSIGELARVALGHEG